MSFKLPTKYVIIAVCVAIFGIFLLGWCLSAKRAKSASNAIEIALNKEIERQTVIINSQKLYVTSIEQEIETLKQAKKDGDVTNQELRKLNLKQVNEISRLQLVVDTLFEDVFFGGEVIEVHDTVNVTRNAIKLPFTFEKKDKFLDLKGDFDAKGKLGLSLKMDASLDIWTGIDKNTKLPSAKVVTNNPYLNVLTVSSIKLDTQKPKKFGIGFQIGYGIGISNPPKFSPYIGIGISRNIIRF
jgi:hypothetical protein